MQRTKAINFKSSSPAKTELPTQEAKSIISQIQNSSTTKSFSMETLMEEI